MSRFSRSLRYRLAMIIIYIDNYLLEITDHSQRPPARRQIIIFGLSQAYEVKLCTEKPRLYLKNRYSYSKYISPWSVFFSIEIGLCQLRIIFLGKLFSSTMAQRNLKFMTPCHLFLIGDPYLNILNSLLNKICSNNNTWISTVYNFSRFCNFGN